MKGEKMKAQWKNGIKVYSEHEDGSPALWYDPSTEKLCDDQESQAVADESEADALAAEWLACYASYEENGV